MARFLKQEKRGTAKKLLPVAAILVVAAALGTAAVLSRAPAGTPNAGSSTEPTQIQIEPAHTTGPASIQETMPEQLQTDSNTAELKPEQIQTDSNTAELKPEQTLPVLEYPIILENGSLEIENLFQYDGMNPDCGDEEGKNVASMMLHNVSGSHLLEADITLTLADGSALTFHVDDLPAGKSAMVFEKSNASAEEDARCADAVCTASWSDASGSLPEDLPVSVDGVAVTVTNNTGRDISELVIYCRCPLGEEYFGGIAYSYTINNLTVNESATVEAWDCILGIAEVVRIAEN